MRTHCWSRTCLWCFLVGIFLLGACNSSSPRSKSAKERKPEVILYSEADDRRVGEEAAKEIPMAIGIVNDPTLGRYVARVGQRLARHAPRSSFAYSFQIVDQTRRTRSRCPGASSSFRAAYWRFLIPRTSSPTCWVTRSFTSPAATPRRARA